MQVNIEKDKRRRGAEMTKEVCIRIAKQAK